MVELTRDKQNVIDRALEKSIHAAFDKIYSAVELSGYKPSEVARYLDRYWDLGDYYREWWQSDPEGEWS